MPTSFGYFAARHPDLFSIRGTRYFARSADLRLAARIGEGVFAEVNLSAIAFCVYLVLSRLPYSVEPIRPLNSTSLDS